MAKQSKLKNHEGAAHADDHVDDHHRSHAHHEHAEEGEPWLVSYADMMTLLFGFFVVMYSFAARDPKSQDCLRVKLMQAFQNLKVDASSADTSDAATQGAALKALQMLVTLLNLESIDDMMEKIVDQQEQKGAEKSSQAKEDLKEKGLADSLKALLGADDIKNTISIVIPSDIAFQPASALLTAESRVKIEQLIKGLKAYNDIAEIEIIGHTDSLPPPKTSAIDNWTLSVLRSSAVGKVFQSEGYTEGMIKVTGRGSSHPLVPEVDKSGKRLPENMARNRRIEIIVKRDKPNG